MAFPIGVDHDPAAHAMVREFIQDIAAAPAAACLVGKHPEPIHQSAVIR